MPETIINYNNKKRIKNLFIGIGIALFALAFIYHILFLSDVIKIYYLVFFSMLFLGCLYLIGVSIKDILSKDKTGLILNETGILSKVTPNGKKLGLIPWKDISALSPTKAFGMEFVSLVTDNPEKYAALLSDQAATKQLLEKNVVLNISTSELDINFEEMKSLIEKYFITYKR